MRKRLQLIYFSFPVQLLILHFRKYQVLLMFWFVLTSTINSGFMKSYGADALFFVPEYLGSVNALSAGLVGVAMGVFFMSWNITTFILHTRRFKFLAATSKPFLKYCINNALLPLAFFLFYLIKSIQFNFQKELLTGWEETLLIAGFLTGFILLIAFSFAFFFGADVTILRSIAPIIADRQQFKTNFDPLKKAQPDGFGMKVGYYLNTNFRFRKTRPVGHYNENFLDSIFKRHHVAGMIGIMLAFAFLITGGFFLDLRFFQAPAAASILIFFAVLVAVIGALTYFMQSWSVLFVIVLLMVADQLYKHEIIDPRNKAYGINYQNKSERPLYNQASVQALCSPDHCAADKAAMLKVLNNWKQRQAYNKPVMILLNISGGGLRSATFAMNVLQELDSLTNGQILRQTFLITGASGGMLSAAYFRELYWQRLKGAQLQLHDPKYLDAIGQDLLNPLFSSMVSRDLFSPVQKFSVGPYRYIKDRGYAFEEKLNENSGGLLGKQIGDYWADEEQALIPMMIFNSAISRDGRKMMVASHPLRFMMKPSAFVNDPGFSPDAVDFQSFFQQQDPSKLRLLTALRMNATFPYVLPNVWLPSEPVIDVMDAGLRDNFGQETSLRFVDHFKEWLVQNTRKVVVLQIRDRMKDNWNNPLETSTVTDMITKPATMQQHNWFKLQDFYQMEQYGLMKELAPDQLEQLTFMYSPKKEDQGATLNFHLTAAEKKDVVESFHNNYNQTVLKQLLALLR